MVVRQEPMSASKVLVREEVGWLGWPRLILDSS